MKILKDHSLKQFNTFGIEASAKELYILDNLSYIEEISTISKPVIIGGGSNILLLNDITQPIILNALKGIQVVDEDQSHVFVQAASGENWHEFVRYTISKNWGGIENLSLIPGNCGAAPMQNIGAYGVELKDVFYSLDAYNINTAEQKTFLASDCDFGYRDSVFKKSAKGIYIITSVTVKLTKRNHILHMDYGAIKDELTKSKISKPGIEDISNAVMQIRSSKLPNPETLGNAGSFFKNPIITMDTFEKIKSKFMEMPFYPIDETSVKIPAGWLIDQLGWKGKRIGNVGCHKDQALVIVNYGGATGQEIKAHAKNVQESVHQEFGIQITPEVNFIS